MQIQNSTSFNQLLAKFRKESYSEKHKGERFEQLMQAYLLTDPKYANLFKNVWLWNEFPGRKDLGGTDTGIDIVGLTADGDYWAMQCKCYQENALIDKPAVDSFLSTSSREFKGEDLKTTRFAKRLWISTTNNWGPNASEAIKNQNPPVSRINLNELIEAPVDWGKLEKGITGELSRTPKKELRPHQQEALEKSHEYFKTANRGKLIMACGTGKTFTALRIAENETQGKGLILFLVPSISLLGQSLREWSADAKDFINAICICSDSAVSRKTTKNEDSDTSSTIDLALPASTNVKDIVHQFQRIQKKKNAGMTVVFSTYQSIEVISNSQKELKKLNEKFSAFDLIICDEAHRTTGVTLSGDDESSFTKVHNNDFIASKKRLYMTATPRLYNDESKSKAAQADALLCSMDDASLYGEEIYRIGFGDAVEKNLLTDYKVLILTLNEKDIPPAVQNIISNKQNEINTDDISKLIGCINALSKQILGDHGILKDNDPDPMRRAVAFCPSIDVSKKITNTFNTATSAYLGSLPAEKKQHMVSVAANHVDGTMNAPKRDELLGWLKAEADDNECRILTNVRCLSEGVDVPSLDAVLFLSARNSLVDVVQSVGRVMRKSPGKQYGYIIIPVLVPSDVEPDKALDDNERYKVIWSVLNALRAHDDRFNATVNKIELNKQRPDQILIGRPEVSFEHGEATFSEGPQAPYGNNTLNEQIALQFEQLQDVVYARMVNKVGSKPYWEQWAKDVAHIAENQLKRIKRLISEDKKHQEAFNNFLGGLRKNINPSLGQDEAVEMLSQHIITKPVFEALFEKYSFVKNNPISVSMQSMLDLLEDQALDKDAETLQKFYESVKMRASGIDNAEGKQRIIIELYDKFFKTAFPKMVEKLGIVYTPVEVVDFIVHSVNDVLKKEFGRTISDENIHILDPFTGTGTFVTRLLQSGLINKKDLERKYKHEIHANEIVLLAYYIAAVNIENAYHDAIGETEYHPFDGICLTDTFQLGESDGAEKLFTEMFPQNSARVAKQKKAPLRVIIGNPPYSVGQKSANDNAQNQKYEKLDARISETYATGSKATSVKDLYNSYFKAFRWASDRLDSNGGVIAFITNSGWLDGNDADGFRKCLQDEFSSVYVLNLRGSIRGRSGESAKREGQNVFDIMTGVAITILVKKKDHSLPASIKYYDIGDYLNREEKLAVLTNTKSITGLDTVWNNIEPNEHYDWISQRNSIFETYPSIGPNKKFDPKSQSYFLTYSLGLATGRDPWVYNFSKKKLESSVLQTIQFYNTQSDEYNSEKNKNKKLAVDNFIDTDPKKISWNRNFKDDLEKNKKYTFNTDRLGNGLYRPFCKLNLYFDRDLNAMLYQNKKLFPTSKLENLTITFPGKGERKGFAAMISRNISDLNMYDGGCQCFPLYFHEVRKIQNPGMFDEAGDSEYIRRDGVSDFILERAKKQYGKNVEKEDIFYYVYGFLHSPEYRKTFANDLKKMLPRLPLLDNSKDFWAFSKAGRKLAELHINYETVPAFDGVKVTGIEKNNFKVEKIRFPKKDQKETIIYNSAITIENIPIKAYDYIINGKSAIEWIMERYQVTVHKESQIKNDPNDWAEEVGNPRYILDLLLSIINVSVQTVKIVEGLPKVKFE